MNEALSLPFSFPLPVGLGSVYSVCELVCKNARPTDFRIHVLFKRFKGVSYRYTKTTMQQSELIPFSILFRATQYKRQHSHKYTLRVFKLTKTAVPIWRILWYVLTYRTVCWLWPKSNNFSTNRKIVPPISRLRTEFRDNTTKKRGDIEWENEMVCTEEKHMK